MKFGTISTSIIVPMIIKGLQSAGATVEAIYSRSEERGRALSERTGVQKLYTDLDAMLADPEIDWIYVASPNSLHYEHTMAALEAGKNVLCEKPFASNAREAQAMADKAKEKGLLLYEALTTTFLPHYDLIRQHLPKIGRLRLLLSSYCQFAKQYTQLLQGERTNAFDPNFSGGCLMDLNYYNVAFAVSLYGEPERVRYAANLYEGIDTSGVAILEYPDFVCECTAAKDTWGENVVQLQGEDGYIYITGASNGLTSVRLVTREEDITSPTTAPFSRWVDEMLAFVPVAQAADPVDYERRMAITLATMRTIDRLRASAGIVFPADEEV